MQEQFVCCLSRRKEKLLSIISFGWKNNSFQQGKHYFFLPSAVKNMFFIIMVLIFDVPSNKVNSTVKRKQIYKVFQSKANRLRIIMAWDGHQVKKIEHA